MRCCVCKSRFQDVSEKLLHNSCTWRATRLKARAFCEFIDLQLSWQAKEKLKASWIIFCHLHTRSQKFSSKHFIALVLFTHSFERNTQALICTWKVKVQWPWKLNLSLFSDWITTRNAFYAFHYLNCSWQLFVFFRIQIKNFKRKNPLRPVRTGAKNLETGIPLSRTFDISKLPITRTETSFLPSVQKCTLNIL